jgi:hypothetical protein
MIPQPKPLLHCPVCKHPEMTLVGIEAHDAAHDLYTFECRQCRHLEAKTVLLP